jgi:hypothetical protein
MGKFGKLVHLHQPPPTSQGRRRRYSRRVKKGTVVVRYRGIWYCLGGGRGIRNLGIEVDLAKNEHEVNNFQV